MIAAKTCVTIVTGPSVAAREEAIATTVASLAASIPGVTIAVLLEGIPDGDDRFSMLQHPPVRHDPVQPHSDFRLLPVVRVVPGCLCCAGNLTMRVHLNRLLRAKPQHLYIGVSPGTHLTALQDFLARPPYDALLVLTDPLAA